ncbi:MAG: L-arabinose isomerase [Saccharofermentanales bacterium]|jgi:L-arabinose isomerase
MINYKFWFVVGSQFLYGEETLARVEKNSKIMVEGLNAGKKLPYEVVYKDTMKTSAEIKSVALEANNDECCAGVITYCHTFSPSKMWINGLNLLQKPWLHFHTQFNKEIPNEEIDMDYMNLHQSAHGDREHGFIGARMRLPRKVVFGYWQDEEALEEIAIWMRAVVGYHFSKDLKVMRFGDNMREVAVTEGDKVEAQIKFGWEVNTWPVGTMVEYMEAVSDEDVDAKMQEYQEKYEIATEDIESIRYQAKEEIAMKRMMDEEGCKAFSNTFQDLYGLEQLSGLASQNLMSDGYGYAGEGDWKTSALTAVMKAMTVDMDGGTTFMEDYTYDFTNQLVLGSHMLEICPSVAAEKPEIEVHALGIGDRQPPARLKFEGKAGSAIVVSLVDMGGRFRLIVHDIECVKPPQTMPNLPVARVMWRPEPNFKEGIKCWILAGGAHHTVLSYDCTVEIMRDWARMMDIEFVHINEKTDPVQFEKDLLVSDIIWNQKK